MQSDVIFSSDGFHHLRYDGSRKEREKKVQIIKFNLIDEAIKIIKNSSKMQEYRRAYCPVGSPDKNGFRKTKLVQWIAFFAVISVTKRLRIRVVVRKVGDGPYHFWSVMPFWKLSNGNRVIGEKAIEDE